MAYPQSIIFRRAAIWVSWNERNWGEYKLPVGSGVGVDIVGDALAPPLPILYSPQFRSHQETKTTPGPL